jgi:hypothetical protein
MEQFIEFYPSPQVKELGIVAYNCSCLATDLGKIFDVSYLYYNITILYLLF